MRHAPFLLVLFLLAPIAAAQVPGGPGSAPTLGVALKAAGADFGALASNSTASVALEATVTMANVVCPQGATMPVTFTVQAKTPTSFLTVAPSPQKVDIVVAGPQYVATPFVGAARSAANATTTLILTNVSVPIEVIASVAGLPAGCSGTGTAGAAASPPVVIYANMTAPPAAALPEPTPPTRFLPAPTLPLAIAGIALVAALRRRRA